MNVKTRFIFREKGTECAVNCNSIVDRLQKKEPDTSECSVRINGEDGRLKCQTLSLLYSSSELNISGYLHLNGETPKVKIYGQFFLKKAIIRSAFIGRGRWNRTTVD